MFVCRHCRRPIPPSNPPQNQIYLMCSRCHDRIVANIMREVRKRLGITRTATSGEGDDL